jgi:hypothetical protein
LGPNRVGLISEGRRQTDIILILIQHTTNNYNQQSRQRVVLLDVLRTPRVCVCVAHHIFECVCVVRGVHTHLANIINILCPVYLYPGTVVSQQ